MLSVWSGVTRWHKLKYTDDFVLGPHTAGRFCRSDHPCPLHSACYGVRKLCQFKRNNKKACLATWNVRKCSRVVPQAGNDDQQWGMNEDEMTKTALRTLENTLVDIWYVKSTHQPFSCFIGIVQ